MAPVSVVLSNSYEIFDFNSPIKAIEFLEDEDKVKVAVVFQGREMAYMESGKTILDKFVEAVGDVAVIDKPMIQEGRSMMMILAPKK